MDDPRGSNDFDEDATQAAWAHEQELEWQDELTNDPGYFQWLDQFAAGAASRTETNNGDYCVR